MKKHHVRILSMLIALVMLVSVLSLTALADEITVSVSDNAVQNGEALVAAVESAHDGDVIVVPAGRYEMPSATYSSPVNGSLNYGLNIDKSITLRGAGVGKTVITSSVSGYSSGMVLFTKYDVDVTIEGISFEGGSWDIIGCDDPGVKAVTIQDCAFTTTGQNTTPIKLKLLSGEISGNTFSGEKCGYAVRIINLDSRDASWGNDGKPTDLKVDISITGNDFSDISLTDTTRGLVHVTTGEPGQVTISENNFASEFEGFAVKNAGSTAVVSAPANYWGDDATIADVANKISGSVTVDTYYTDDEMSEEVPVGGIPVGTVDQLKNAIENAQNGDVIVVPAGEYDVAEPIVIEKSITLKGANAGLDARPNKAERAAETVLDGTGITAGWDSGCIFVISADDVTIDGFTFDNANYAAVAIGSADNSKDTEIKNAVIQNNIFLSTDRRCDQAITGEEQKYPCTVRNNYFNGINANVKVLSAHGLIVDNQFDNCSASSALALFYDNNYDYSEDLTFSGNTVNGFKGAAVISAQWLYNVVANDNVIADCDTTFLSATVSSGLEAKGNTFNGVELGDKNLFDIYWFDYGNFQGYSIEGHDFATGITTTGKIIHVQEHDGNVPIDTNDYDNITVDASGNYWGKDVTAAQLAGMIDGNVAINTYYTDAAMTEIATLGGTPVASMEQLRAAIATAEDGAVIVVAPGEYDGNALFGGKSLTIKAQYPAYKDGVKETDDKKLSQFTGTFNTYNGTTDASFDADQKVVIEGFAFSDDGLKIGNNNYNTVGNLEVRHCTMEFGKNLDPVNSNNYAGYNYFVKLSGNAGAPYASVIVEDNYVSGTPVANVYPIQLWDVDKVIVRNNVLNLENAENHQAISISKMATNAEVEVSGNRIYGAGGGIYVTTWLLGGETHNATAKFTGAITVKNNTLQCVDSDMEPIFIGYEDVDNAPYGLLDGSIELDKNTNNGKNVAATVVFGPKGADEDYFVVLVKDGNELVEQAVVQDGDRYTLPSKPSKKGYTFLGWKSSADREVYKAGATVKIYEDTTFTAQWMSNWEIVDDVAGAAGSGKEFFTDVKPGDWYYDAVKFVFDNNFMDGVGDGKFNPDGTLTRAMIAQVLYNLEGETSSYPSVFDDVAKSAWYADAVNWAAASGIVEGKGNNKFDPNAAITRQEMAAILYRYSELKGYDVSDVDSLAAFTDADKVASWAKEPMGWAVENYVINGKGNGKLDPTGTATRAEVAQILMNLCNNVL